MVRVDPTSGLGTLLVQHVAEMPLSFSEWEKILRNTTSHRVVRVLASEKMLALANTFAELDRLCRVAQGQSLREEALKRMAPLASSLEEKVRLYELSDGPAREGILLELKNIAKNFEGWQSVFEDAEEGSDFEHFAASMLIECAPADPRELDGLLDYRSIYHDDELHAAVLEKLKSTSGTFDAWKKLYDCGSDHDEVKELATEKMIGLVENVEQLIEAAEAVDDDEDGRKKLIARVKELALDKKALEEILNDYDNDDFLFAIALEKLVDMADTALRCLCLYAAWEMEDDESEKVLDKLFSLATWDECAIIALVAEEDDELYERAERKLNTM